MTTGLLVLAAGLGSLATLGASANDGDPRCFGETPTVVGTADDDRIVGEEGEDVIDALGGDDIIRSEAGDDVVCGRSGEDQVLAGSGDDEVSGGVAHDRLFGGPGTDVLHGRERVDLVTGEKGDGDVCRGGGPSRDTLRRGDLSDGQTCERIRGAYLYGRFTYPDGKILH